MRAGLGLLVGLGLILLLEYLDTSVRKRSEVESLGCASLAKSPNIGKMVAGSRDLVVRKRIP